MTFGGVSPSPDVGGGQRRAAGRDAAHPGDAKRKYTWAGRYGNFGSGYNVETTTKRLISRREL